ncbi:MAG: DUF3140 domain-containing protein [Allosphingosinicella sp.]
MTLDCSKIAADFAASVNMESGELEAWLETDESRRVGFKRDGGGESVGHASGRRIVELLRSGPSRDEDYRHMRKTVGFIRRHRAREPANMATSRWRYSLMNWGHDPLR